MVYSLTKKRDIFSECMVWRGCEGGSFIEDDGTITPSAPPEKERIKRSLSEGEKALSFLVKIFREGVFFFFK